MNRLKYKIKKNFFFEILRTSEKKNKQKTHI